MHQLFEELEPAVVPALEEKPTTVELYLSSHPGKITVTTPLTCGDVADMFFDKKSRNLTLPTGEHSFVSVSKKSIEMIGAANN